MTGDTVERWSIPGPVAKIAENLGVLPFKARDARVRGWREWWPQEGEVVPAEVSCGR